MFAPIDEIFYSIIVYIKDREYINNGPGNTLKERKNYDILTNEK